MCEELDIAKKGVFFGGYRRTSSLSVVFVPDHLRAHVQTRASECLYVCLHSESAYEGFA